MNPMERLAQLHGLLDEIHAKTVSFTSVEDAAAYAGLVEQAARKIDALAVAVLDSVDRLALHKDDGFSTVQSWNAFVCRTTRGETTRRAGVPAWRACSVTCLKLVTPTGQARSAVSSSPCC